MKSYENNQIDKVEELVKKWGDPNLIALCKIYNMQFIDIATIAYERNLYNIETPNNRRKWSQDEDQFLIKFYKVLNSKQVSNLLYRSRKAVFERQSMLRIIKKE